MKKLLLFISFLFLLSSCSFQNKEERIKYVAEILGFKSRQYFPNPIGHVNDFAQILDSLKIHSLEEKLDQFEKRTTNQIAIVTINSEKLTEENFDQFALDLANFWRVGVKEKNNGLVMVLSPQLRKIRICTGLGTEKILTDQICENIVQTIIIPEFKKGNYFEGLDQATDEFIRLWK